MKYQTNFISFLTKYITPKFNNNTQLSLYYNNN